MLDIKTYSFLSTAHKDVYLDAWKRFENACVYEKQGNVRMADMALKLACAHELRALGYLEMTSEQIKKFKKYDYSKKLYVV